MRIVICDNCGYHFVVDDDAEWGYCPCCEKEPIEIKGDVKR